MPYSWQALLSVWIIVFGVFALIASGTVVGAGRWLLAPVGLAAPAIILALDEKRRRAAKPIQT